jgi:hypothetical protein
LRVAFFSMTKREKSFIASTTSGNVIKHLFLRC